MTKPLYWLCIPAKRGPVLEPVEAPPPGTIRTAALIICQRCRRPISGMGGPKPHATCNDCVESLGLLPKCVSAV